MSKENDLPEFPVSLTSKELFAIKEALGHTDRYYTKRNRDLADFPDDNPKRLSALNGHRATRWAIQKIDEALDRVLA